RVAYKRTFYLMDDGGDVKFSQHPTNYIPTHPDDDVKFTFTKEQIKNIRDNNGKIYTAFYVSNKKISVFNQTEITIEDATSMQSPSMSTVILDAPFMAISPAFYGLTHRGWGQFLYNGGIVLQRNDGEWTGNIEHDFSTSPIDMEIVNIDPDEVQSDLDNVDPTDPGTVS